MSLHQIPSSNILQLREQTGVSRPGCEFSFASYQVGDLTSPSLSFSIYKMGLHGMPSSQGGWENPMSE